MSFKAISVTRKPFEGVPPPLLLFRPAMYSNEELHFFLLHLGQSPVVVLHGEEMPKGVNAVAVERVLGRLYELEELRKAKGVEWGQMEGLTWTGIAAIRDSIERYLKWVEKSYEIYRRSKRSATPIRHPSQYEWDSRKRPHKFGTDADGNTVVSEITADGKRVSFDVHLTEDFTARDLDLPDDFLSKREDVIAAAPTDLIHDPDAGVYTCPICKFSQSYPAHDRKKMQMAHGRMGRHLKTERRKEVDAHRVLYSRLFR
jgi:hypothetical protein